MKVTFNEGRALEVLPILARLWERREGIFKGERLPQELWTPQIKGSRTEKAHWYFYAAHAMRGGIVSEDPFRWLFHLRKRFPSTFDPQAVMAEWNPDRLREAAQTVTSDMIVDGTRKPTKGVGALGFKFDELAEHWCHNSSIIATRWNSNVLNVFEGVSTFEEAFTRIDWQRTNGLGIRGMRRKIFSLFTIWLQEQELIPLFPTPIPIDFHALRVLWSTGIIDIATSPIPPKERYPKMFHGLPAARINENVTDEVSRWSETFLARHGISHLAVNPALWVLSRRLCAEHFQNISRDAGKTFILPDYLKSHPGAWPKNYRNPCSICPVERWCIRMVPAAIYYDVGILIALERVPYPQGLLPGIDWQHHITPKSRKGRNRNQQQKAPTA